MNMYLLCAEKRETKQPTPPRLLNFLSFKQRRILWKTLIESLPTVGPVNVPQQRSW